MTIGKEVHGTDNECARLTDQIPTDHQGAPQEQADLDEDYLPLPRIVCRIGVMREIEREERARRAASSPWSRVRRWFQQMF
ncbi:hypothetical protein D3C78_1431760 [compost metagenome]